MRGDARTAEEDVEHDEPGRRAPIGAEWSRYPSRPGG
jgi:hypothetical protein